jgi:long-chain fatty acid transport protein
MEQRMSIRELGSIVRGRLSASTPLVALACALCGAGPAGGAGFLIFEQGSKAMGMGGAFTAQADDGSAMFHNVAGLAFQRETSYDLGVTLLQPDSDFTGLAPFPGPGAAGSQESTVFYPVHFYFVKPLSDRLTFGVGFNSPFGLSTDWENPEEWPGRFISAKAELRAFDLNPSVGWKTGDRFGVGFGLVARISDVELERFLARPNPFAGTASDIATANLQSDFDTGIGWNVGILSKVGEYFSWGFSYRSKITIDYGGDGVFTQIPTGFPQFDAQVAAVIPFGQNLPIETSIEFPDLASLGVALGLTRSILVEIDVNWAGWSTFDEVLLDFTTAPAFSSVIPNDWDDAYNYRIGVRLGDGQREWRFGYIHDESPQPDESVGPLLPDADRNDYTIGIGSPRYDVALMYVDFDSRTTTTNRDGFFGSYNTDVWLLGLTVKF